MADNDMNDYSTTGQSVFAQGYRAGLAAALKALEEWRDEAPLTEPCIATAAYAVQIVKALLEEKP